MISKNHSDTGVYSFEDDGLFEITPMTFDVVEASRLTEGALWHLSATAPGAGRFIAPLTSGSAAGVQICIVDEGVNYRHADLWRAYDQLIDYDPRDALDYDAAPDTSTERHGTQVAGLIGGDISNDIGTVGAAQGSTLTASYLRFGPRSDVGEIDDIVRGQAHFDVSNNSWGFTRAFADAFNTQAFADIGEAIQSVAAEGRGGLGTVMVFAAGNGRIDLGQGNIGDDSNFHNMTNSRFTIAVGAHDATGSAASFSSPGTNVLLTAPGVGLLTTTGTEAGSTASAYVSGTSFAAPLVSSTVALMLGENPNLGYRDVQEILVLSSESRTGTGVVENGYGGFNGGGLHFSREGGFGMLNAAAAVSLARNWTQTSTLANEDRADLVLGGGLGIDGAASFEGVLPSSDMAPFRAQWVEIDLSLTDPNLRDLRIELVAPSGTRAVIAENLNAIGRTTALDFTFSSVVTWGEDPAGAWRLELTHNTTQGSFTVENAAIRVYGDQEGISNEYYFTDNFSTLAGQDATRAILADANEIGTDTLNFSASSSGLTLDISGETASWFQGTTLGLASVFENAVGTTGNDILRGNALANRLVGDFGHDSLIGGVGEDDLSGGIGDDTLDGGSERDYLLGGAGSDRIFGGTGDDVAFGGNGEVAAYDASSDVIYLAAGNDIANGQGGNDFVYGDDGDDFLYGDTGEDLVAGGAGADYLFGNEGSDRIYGGQGNDILYGGADSDRFIFGENGLVANEVDVIVDLNLGAIDEIWLPQASHASAFTYAGSDGYTYIALQAGGGLHQIAVSGTTPSDVITQVTWYF